MLAVKGCVKRGAHRIPVHKGMLIEAQGEVGPGILLFELDSCSIMGTCCLDFMVKDTKMHLSALMPQM